MARHIVYMIHDVELVHWYKYVQGNDHLTFRGMGVSSSGGLCFFLFSGAHCVVKINWYESCKETKHNLHLHFSARISCSKTKWFDFYVE